MNELEATMPTTITATRKIDQLIINPKNPRGVKEADFERLKRQITRLGMYKPVIIDKNNKVLGGNMRVRAYKEMGIEDVWVSVVDTQDGKMETDYILSDNDEVGTWELDDLAELITESVGLPLEDYKVATFEPINLSKFLEQTSGNGDESEKEKENDPTDKEIECPRCHLHFKEGDKYEGRTETTTSNN